MVVVAGLGVLAEVVVLLAEVVVLLAGREVRVVVVVQEGEVCGPEEGALMAAGERVCLLVGVEMWQEAGSVVVVAVAVLAVQGEMVAGLEEMGGEGAVVVAVAVLAVQGEMVAALEGMGGEGAVVAEASGTGVVGGVADGSAVGAWAEGGVGVVALVEAWGAW